RVDTLIAAIAAKQHGVFSSTQVSNAGGDPRLVYRRMEACVWVRLSDRAYALAGSPLSFHSRVTAACLTAGDWSFASHGTATALWLGAGSSVGTHLWTPNRLRAAGINPHVGRLDKADVTRLGPIPITRPER